MGLCYEWVDSGPNSQVHRVWRKKYGMDYGVLDMGSLGGSVRRGELGWFVVCAEEILFGGPNWMVGRG